MSDETENERAMLESLIQQWERLRGDFMETAANSLIKSNGLSTISKQEAFARAQRQLHEAMEPINKEIAALYAKLPPKPPK